VSRGIVSVEADGVAVVAQALRLTLLDDGMIHHVVVRLG
jgi:hypothetical protein